MTPRERVLAAFNHQQPDRTPCWCGASQEFWDKAKQELDCDDEQLRERLGDDFRRVLPDYTGPQAPLPEEVTSRTVFGIERAGIGYGHPTSHPLAQASIEDVHAYPWPDPEWIDVSTIHSNAAKYQGHYAILGGDWSPFWHDAIDLMGMTDLFIQMHTKPEVVDALFGHIVDYYAAINESVFAAAAEVIDVFFFGNDFGSQTGPLLGPDLFERFVLPHLRRLINLAHDYNLKTQLHCCGGFSPLIPLMIDVGLDALHAVQPSCYGMDLRTLKKDFGSKMVFNGCIDSHHVLIEGTADHVRRETRRVIEIMAPGGGFIAGASHDAILPETPLENVLAMFDTITNTKLAQ
jgi:uroporphyrinogen-III decarboxylase